MYGQWISPSSIYRGLKRLGLTKKEASGQSSSGRPASKTKRIILGKVKNVELKNLVFISGNGAVTWFDKELSSLTSW